jgi:hypothetical protein
MRSEPNVLELSEDEWIAYLKAHYPPRVVRDLIGIQQTTAYARQPLARPAKPNKKRARRVTSAHDPTRLHRYLTHAVVLAVATAMLAHDPTPLFVASGIGIAIIVLLLVVKDAVSSAVAFTIRSRSTTGSFEMTVRVKASSWDSAPVARVLTLAAILLPPEYRADYVEEQYANLVTAESHRERFDYLLDLVLEIPRVAWQFWAERKRDPVK